ncbi:hypothetical protein Bbelb_053920 [Branchiostoma belcheri]|nr:hypothetical protein Bbelb_053920 [Branchiostoma belcheri]
MDEIQLVLITLNPDGTDTKLGHMVLVLYKSTKRIGVEIRNTARHGMRKHHDRIFVSATKTGSHIDLDTAQNREGTLHGHSDLSLELSRLHQREQRLYDLVTSLVSSLPGMDPGAAFFGDPGPLRRRSKPGSPDGRPEDSPPKPRQDWTPKCHKYL